MNVHNDYFGKLHFVIIIRIMETNGTKKRKITDFFRYEESIIVPASKRRCKPMIIMFGSSPTMYVSQDGIVHFKLISPKGIDMNTRFYKRFIKGLKVHGLTESDMVHWRYAGSNRHLKYWNLKFPGVLPPIHKHHCICRTRIVENCYIAKIGKKLTATPPHDGILVIGNCCIQNFIVNDGRRCQKCDARHFNRVVDICNQCRQSSKGVKYGPKIV